MKKKLLTTAITTAVAATILVPCQVSAKESGYKFLERYGNTKVTAGSYTFKYEKDGSISIKKGSGSVKKASAEGHDAAVSSKDMYYFKDNVLMKYTLKSGKIEKVKTFNKTPAHNEMDEDIGYCVSACSGNSIYITSDSFADWKYSTYSYNTGNGKTKKLFDGAIFKTKGNYAVADMHYRTDMSPTSYNIYKLTSDGAKKICTLSKSSYGVYTFNGKYYCSTVIENYNGGRIRRGSKITSCSFDGKNLKTIKELKGNADLLHFYKDKIYFIEHFDDNNNNSYGKLCELGKDGKGYRVLANKINVFDLEKIENGKIYYSDGSTRHSVDIKTGKISKVK